MLKLDVGQICKPVGMLRMPLPDVGAPLRWVLGVVTSAIRPAPDAVRVMIVADQSVFAEAMAFAVDGRAAMSCVGVAAGSEQAQRLASHVRPDVAVVDLEPDERGFETIRTLLELQPALRVLLLTDRTPSPALMWGAAEAGASAVFPKTTSLGVVVSAIPSLSEHLFTTDRRTIVRLRQSAEGTGRDQVAAPDDNGRAAANGHVSAVDPPDAEIRIGTRSHNGNTPAPPNPLTRRERDILGLLERGIDVPSASERLGISVNTTRGYVKNLYRKLDVHSQVELLAVARSKGLLDEGD